MSNDINHIALIPDGGRRWAEKNSVSLTESYRQSMHSLKKLLLLFMREEIRQVTVFFSSRGNFLRHPKEVEAFRKVEEEFLLRDMPAFSKEHDADIRIIGNLDERYLSSTLLNSCDGDRLCSGRTRRINFCMNYSSLSEISESASNSVKWSISSLPIPDLVNVLIRTGGANVLSDFLLPQLAFARLYFLDELFNDLKPETVCKILDEYRSLPIKHGE